MPDQAEHADDAPDPGPVRNLGIGHVDPGWTPAFPGQRPPFRPGNEHRVTVGNTLSTRHGAYSERTVRPLAAEIEARARRTPSWPTYLADETYGPAVAAWARAEAVVELLVRHLDGLGEDLGAALGETSSTATATGPGRRKGETVTRTSGRRVAAVLALLDRAESRAATLRARLGLDPLARSRLARDLAGARRDVDLAELLTRAREDGDRDHRDPGETP